MQQHRTSPEGVGRQELTAFDVIDNRSVPAPLSGNQSNALNSLKYLSQGLSWLARAVGSEEQKLAIQLPSDKRLTLWGNNPELSTAPMGMLACSFHWYAVSACNFVRLAGWLTNGGDDAAALDYLKAVLPDVKVWRDKVGAHFAIAGPLPKDSQADLMSSVLFPIGWDDDCFVAAPMNLVLGGRRPSASSLQRWSVTRTHEALQSRFPMLAPAANE